MKTTLFLTSLLFSCCLCLMPNHCMPIQAVSMNTTAVFDSKTWSTKEGEITFISLQDGYMYSAVNGVQLNANKTGSAMTTDAFPSVTRVVFNINGNSLGRGQLSVMLVSGEEETLFATQAIDTSLGSKQLYFDTYGTGQIKFVISCSGGTIYLPSLTIQYGDESLNRAHAYASSFLNETDHQGGQCHLIDWDAFAESYQPLDDRAKAYLTSGTESALLTAFTSRYRYLVSTQGFVDYLYLSQSLSKISGVDSMTMPLAYITLFLLVSLIGYVLLKRHSALSSLN